MIHLALPALYNNKRFNMNLILTLLVLLSTCYSLQLRGSHDYWFMKDNPVQSGNDQKWNYCDLKCLYL
jgi:hypothetical protein